MTLDEGERDSSDSDRTLSLNRSGDCRLRRLGEIQLTVRYVCLRHCLRVLVNGCR